MNSLHWESFGTSRKGWQPFAPKEPDCVLVALGCFFRVSETGSAGLRVPAGQVEGKRRLGGVARQLGVGREPEFFLR